MGNMLYASGRVTAVLDWDLVHLGDAEADLAGFLLMEPESQTRGPITLWAGLPSPDETLRYYESQTGRSVDKLSYWRVVRLLRPTLISWRLGKIRAEAAVDESHARDMLMRIAQMIGVQ